MNVATKVREGDVDIMERTDQSRRKEWIMKANKALKRLAKIETLISDVTERYSGSASQIQDVLQDAKAAVVRAKEAIQASSTAKEPPVKDSQRPSRTATEPKRKLSAAGREAIIAATKKRSEAKKAAAKAGPSVARKATPTKEAPLRAAKTSAPTVAKKAPTKKAAAKAPAKKPVKVLTVSKTPAVPKTAATTVSKPEQAVPEAPVQ